MKEPTVAVEPTAVNNSSVQSYPRNSSLLLKSTPSLFHSLLLNTLNDYGKINLVFILLQLMYPQQKLLYIEVGGQEFLFVFPTLRGHGKERKRVEGYFSLFLTLSETT